MKTKVCNGCEEEKSLDDFYLKNDGTDEYRYLCKDCYNESRREYSRKWSKENRDKINKSRRKSGERNLKKGLCYKCSNPLASSFYCQKHLDKQRELSRKMREKRQELGVCYVCGNELDSNSSWYCSNCLTKKAKNQKKYRERKEKRNENRI